ncbi:MAG: (Fe-S)-binding protein [Gammaproteobacteria bacterium]|nr:(Fe-S)-binding protein [Gammaproteobacteria bacterium]
MADFETPELRKIPVVPKIKPGVMAHLAPHVAKPDVQQPLGYPGELVDNWEQVAIDKLDELKGKYRSLQIFLDACVGCGVCTDKCHSYLGTADPKNMPVARQDLLRSVYRRYYTLAGKWFPKWVGARDMTREVLDEWYSYFHQCSQCRRCAVFCPFGIDTAEIAMAAREIMDSVGRGQKYSNEVIGKVFKFGNNLGLPEKALANTLENLEEDVEEETGIKVRFPLDEKGAEVLLMAPSADFFAEPHVDSLIGYGKVFHQAGTSWTISSLAAEGGNFGLFIGSYNNMRKAARRVREAALDLGVKRIVFGECGHAWRVAYSFLNTLAGPFDFLDPRYPVPQHICEVTYDLMQRGVLKFDKSQNDHMVLTFHDSCNVARASGMGDRPGGQFTIPREIIKATCNHYTEMSPNTLYDATFCCGAGGGTLTDELIELRVKGAMPRLGALKHVMDTKGVTHMVSICAICKSQFSKVMPYFDFDGEMSLGIHQLVSNAIILGKQD